MTRAYSRPYSPDTRPIVGITTNHEGTDATLRDTYYRQIAAAGGTPLLIPPIEDPEVVASTLDSIDALLLSGGGDINPLWTGEEPRQGLGHINGARDLPELMITRMAFNRQMPILGICRGMQTMATALGGQVQQDMGRQDSLCKHSQDADREVATHSVTLEADCVLRKLYGNAKIYVNSFHHQAVATPGQHMRVTAKAADGVTEAMEGLYGKPLLGVQWHPEWLGDDGRHVFRWLVDEARLYKDTKRFHRRNTTLDSHCDTPMFFPQGIDFSRRDPHILYDMHKMREGMVDAVTMVAYVPQPECGVTFAEVAPFPTDSPKAYADLILDMTDTLVADNSSMLARVKTAADITANKRDGKKSLLTGIENGLALEHDIANVEHFAKRGITYITLCHNGDNAICDSARRTQHTHGGVSDFGAQVIAEMNRLGLIVDLSHAGESSFYDALELSRTPIVCSHSCCKALCDVPRNITDDQLRALARHGGVCQITLYNGFLRTDGRATIEDAMRHLLHAIDTAGIDHVGIGSDFDGDGGIPGLADASELCNITRELLRKRFSEEDIAKIWGGNWLRVMSEAQACAQRT